MINFTEQFKTGQNAAIDIKINFNPERAASGEPRLGRVIFCGMGGSIIPAEIISMLWLRRFGRSPDPLLSGLDDFLSYIHRGYNLPHWADSKSLVLATSWSGNTEETISSLKSAIDKKIPTVAITTGGEVAKLAKANSIPLIILENNDESPRMNVGQMLAALLTLLINSAIIEFKLPTDINVSSDVGLDLARKITNKTPLIYSSYQWRYLARFWKIHFNEDCKIMAFSNYLPEASHNEIAAFGGEPRLGRASFNQTGPTSYFPIIIIDPRENASDINKLEKFSEFLKNQNINHEIIQLADTTRIESILNNYNQATSTALELAKIMGINSLDNSIIDKFKKTIV